MFAFDLLYLIVTVVPPDDLHISICSVHCLFDVKKKGPNSFSSSSEFLQRTGKKGKGEKGKREKGGNISSREGRGGSYNVPYIQRVLTSSW